MKPKRKGNSCLCGANPGERHDPDCPWQEYSSNGKIINQWLIAWAANVDEREKNETNKKNNES